MKAILTSSLGGSIKRDGMRIPTPLLGDNGLIEKIKEYWNDDTKILLISASPDEYESLLLGGHIPTQNAFFKKLGLREKIASLIEKNYHYLVNRRHHGNMELTRSSGFNLGGHDKQNK